MQFHFYHLLYNIRYFNIIDWKIYAKLKNILLLLRT
nr:MAG TPA: hypothetical protein [Caudoviricetes sp.]